MKTRCRDIVTLIPIVGRKSDLTKAVLTGPPRIESAVHMASSAHSAQPTPNWQRTTASFAASAFATYWLY